MQKDEQNSFKYKIVRMSIQANIRVFMGYLFSMIRFNLLRIHYLAPKTLWQIHIGVPVAHKTEMSKPYLSTYWSH